MDDSVLTAALAGLLFDVGIFARRAGEKGNLDSLSVSFVEKYVPERFGEAIKGFMEKKRHLLKLADHLAAGARSDRTSADPIQLISIFSLVTSDAQKGERFHLPLKPLEIDEQTILRRTTTTAPGYDSMWKEFCGTAKSLAIIDEKELYLESLLLLFQRYTWCMPTHIEDICLYDHSRMRAALTALLSNSTLTDESLKKISDAPNHSDHPIALLVGGDLSGVQEFIYTVTNKGATSALRGRSFYLQLLNEAVARYILSRLDLPIANLIYAGGGNFYLLARPTDMGKLNDIRRDISRILNNHHKGNLYVAVAGVQLREKDFVCTNEERHVLGEKWNDLAQELAIAKNRRFSELDKEELDTLFKPQGHGGNDETACKACGQEFPKEEFEVISSGGESVEVCRSCYSYYELGKDLRRANYLIMEYLAIKPSGNLARVKFILGRWWEAILASVRRVYPGRWAANRNPNQWQDVLRAFGFTIHVKESLVRFPSQKPRLILALNDAALSLLSAEKHQAFGRRLLVNVAPLLTQNEFSALKQKGVEDLPDRVDESNPPIKPFGALSAQSKGIERLGILRMDVDNLGKLFAEGLGKHACLARIASLSFAVSLYFEGWVGELAKARNIKRRRDDEQGQEGEIPRGDGLYAIYSGGDDLFFVGSWDEVVELAREIRRDLEIYTGHPGIHASGGIVLVTEKYPLAKAAEDCHRAEQKAKGMKWWDKNGKRKEKDVIAFLGLPLPWEQFGTEECASGTTTAHALMHLLEDGIKDNAVIQILLNNYAKYVESENNFRKQGKGMTQNHRPQTLYGPWNWRVLYSLRRKLKSKEDENLSRLADHLDATPEAMSLIGLAARWAEFKLR